MMRHQWLSALPLFVMAALAVSQVDAADIRDRAGMFSPEAVKKAQAELERIEQKTGISVLIETIDAIPELDAEASNQARRKAIDDLADRRFNQVRNEGVYLSIAKRDKVFSHLLVRHK